MIPESIVFKLLNESIFQFSLNIKVDDEICNKNVQKTVRVLEIEK